MKKNFLVISLLLLLFIVIVICLFVIPRLSTKEITFELKDMQVEDVEYDKNTINIYLFYGDGCPHCEEMIAYLNTLSNSLKRKINLYTFEVWYNEESYQLLMDLGTYIDVTPKNIPFLFIGDTYYEGFNKQDKEEIKKTIQKYIKSKGKKDVFKEYREVKAE